MKSLYKSATAFTMIEVLCATSIVAVLAAIVVPSVGNVRAQADRTTGLSNLRQVGIAAMSYATENQGLLPGPAWVGQTVWYSSGDDRTFGTKLWPYLGLPESQTWSQEAKILGNPAYYKARQGSGSPSFMLNSNIKLPDGSNVNPWGYKEPNGTISSLPMNLPSLAAAGLSKTWAMRDVDQTWPGVSTAGWYSQLPKKPVFGKYRVSLNFDLSAELVGSNP